MPVSPSFRFFPGRFTSVIILAAGCAAPSSRIRVAGCEGRAVRRAGLWLLWNRGSILFVQGPSGVLRWSVGSRWIDGER